MIYEILKWDERFYKMGYICFNMYKHQMVQFKFLIYSNGFLGNCIRV